MFRTRVAMYQCRLVRHSYGFKLRTSATPVCLPCTCLTVCAAQHLPDVLIKPPPLRMDGLHVLWCTPWDILPAPQHFRTSCIVAAGLRWSTPQ